MLRHPVELFHSLYDYYEMESTCYHVDLETYACAEKTQNLTDRRKVFHIGRNQMMFDLGLPIHKFEDEQGINS